MILLKKIPYLYLLISCCGVSAISAVSLVAGNCNKVTILL